MPHLPHLGWRRVWQVGHCDCHTTTPLGVWGVAWQVINEALRCGRSGFGRRFFVLHLDEFAGHPLGVFAVDDDQ
jgi:hypothetical protein